MTRSAVANRSAIRSRVSDPVPRIKQASSSGHRAPNCNLRRESVTFLPARLSGVFQDENDAESLRRPKSRKPYFWFSMVGIPEDLNACSQRTKRTRVVPQMIMSAVRERQAYEMAQVAVALHLIVTATALGPRWPHVVGPGAFERTGGLSGRCNAGRPGLPRMPSSRWQCRHEIGTTPERHVR